jgi:hypothetical protein
MGEAKIILMEVDDAKLEVMDVVHVIVLKNSF